MPCKQYKDALAESAACGSEPQGELRAHLAACADCRAAFGREQSLFASIDAGLQLTANAEVPASLFPRVRASLDEAAMSHRRWMQPLIFAAASVALVAIVFLIARPHRAAPDGQARQIPAIPAPVPRATDTHQKISPSGTLIASIGANHSHTVRNSTLYRPAASSKPEVLVPPDERDALARFVATLSQRSGFASDLLAPGPEKKDALVSVDLLQIGDIEVKPLEDRRTAIPDRAEEKQ